MPNIDSSRLQSIKEEFDRIYIDIDNMYNQFENFFEFDRLHKVLRIRFSNIQYFLNEIDHANNTRP